MTNINSDNGSTLARHEPTRPRRHGEVDVCAQGPLATHVLAFKSQTNGRSRVFVTLYPASDQTLAGNGNRSRAFTGQMCAPIRSNHARPTNEGQARDGADADADADAE
ncbi:hypothetical protein E4U21_007599 [Claviceps maximensis]|nr:hypothetical protein E4U21_007599 [Claviceps maximensis]